MTTTSIARRIAGLSEEEDPLAPNALGIPRSGRQRSKAWQGPNRALSGFVTTEDIDDGIPSTPRTSQRSLPANGGQGCPEEEQRRSSTNGAVTGSDDVMRIRFADPSQHGCPRLNPLQRIQPAGRACCQLSATRLWLVGWLLVGCWLMVGGCWCWLVVGCWWLVVGIPAATGSGREYYIIIIIIIILFPTRAAVVDGRCHRRRRRRR